jgi:membrane protein implicated in regulation of membrane protease activity
MSALEKFFLTSALCGTVIFCIRMALMLIGLTGDFGDDGAIDGGGEHEAVDMIHDTTDMEVTSDSDVVSHGSDGSDSSFKFLSLQGLTAFFMMFGWVGLAMIRDSGFSSLTAIIGGLIAGLISVYALACIFRFALSLQSDGTMRISSAMGAGGKVYLRIPASGSGQVQVEVDGRLQIFDAISADKVEIPTGEQITVVWIQDNGVLVVEKDERDIGGRLCGP